MKILLPDERPMSNNVLYHLHWAEKAEEIQRVNKEIKYSVPRRSLKMATGKVNIFITAYFKNRPLDSDNIAAKLYVDGLKGRAIKDDTPEFVGYVATKSEVDKVNPRVEIEIE